ncbi:MAG: immunoglobulin-like domain-containing protein, partial [Candidatus Izemoplasmatales bacterium]|nr:immunoglobulin-like domain-containing protein [Candidatus Izemoplasmatales bacterium]
EIVITITGPNQVATGQTISLQVSVEPISVNPAVTWSIKDQVNGIVSINQNGVITGLAVGSVTIIATLNEFSNNSAEYVITVLLSPEISVSVLGGGLLVNNPEGSQVRVQANMAGTLIYVQDSGTLNATQILASANKRSVSVSSGTQDVMLTITSGTKLHFVLAVFDGDNLVMTSSVITLEFHLLSATVFVSNYTELVAALNRTDNVNIVLTADITATGNFTPTRTQAFVNTFDGAGFKIINFSLVSNSSDSGMFRNLGANAVIKNITFVNPRVSAGHANVGLLAGRVSQAGDILIQNVKVIGLETTITSSQWGHGGLIGTINTNNASVTIEQVYMEYKFQTASSSVSSGNLGGLVGTQFNTSSLTVRHTQVIMTVSFANTGNSGQIISAVVGQVNTGTTTNISYVYAGIRNVGPGNPLSNGGIVYSQMNNAGTSHTISNIVVMSDSTVSQVTSQITTINGTNSKTNSAITNEFHVTLTEALGNRFAEEKATVWKYESSTNMLVYRILTEQEQAAQDTLKANEIQAAIVISNPNTIMDDIVLPILIQGITITWESSNPAVLSNTGEVSRPENNDATLTLTYSFNVGSIQRSGVIHITVLQKEVVIDIELDILGFDQVAVGQTITLTTQVSPSFVPNQVVWSVALGSEAIVSISETGIVTGLSSGTATLVATLVEDNAVVATHEVIVYLQPSLSVSVQGSGLSLDDPAQSVVSITTNMGGKIFYVQNAINQTAQQILDSSSKQSIDIPVAGSDTYTITITSGTKLQFVLVTYNGSEIEYVSNVFILSFTLLSNAVMVSNYDELVAALNRTDDVNIVLTANITATGNFTPTRTTAFISTFDGQGYTITGLSLLSNGNDIGMFRRIGGGAVIKNIVFESPRISTAHANSGLISGRVSAAGNVLIENIIVKNLITTVTSSQWTHGGLIGLINTAGANVTVKEIYLTFTFQTTNSSVSTGNMGGIVGVQSSTSTLTISHVFSDVIVNLANANNTGQIIAAVIGQVNSGTTSHVSYVFASVRNTGVSANAISNAGLVYSQLNTAGNNHTISNIMIHPLSTRTVAFVNNNGNSQVNGSTTNNATSVTNQMLTLSSSTADIFVQNNSSVWMYQANTNELSYILPQ